MDALSTADYLRSRSCEGENIYGPRSAREVAETMRAQGEPRIEAYRCLFDHPGRWHVGHALSMESIQRMAMVMRENAHGPRQQ